MKQIIEQLLDGQDLSLESAQNLMFKIMSGSYDDIQIAGFLVALRAKGETADEIAGFAAAMRDKMTPVPFHPDAIDMCGTGGDASGTFNISTAAALVAAGAGVKVAKHGNRSMTSQSGSADVLSALGVDIAMPVEKFAECLESIGIGFLFAPAYHPAMKYALTARKRLAVRTVFNLLGPLSNPARVQRQVIGVFSGHLINTMAKALKRLGSREAYILHGNDGLDEITTVTDTLVSHLKESGTIESLTWRPENFGIFRAELRDLQGGTPKENAAIIKSILNGAKTPCRDIVVLNAAAGIAVGGRAPSMQAAIGLAEESINSGSAENVLKKLVAIS